MGTTLSEPVKTSKKLKVVEVIFYGLTPFRIQTSVLYDKKLIRETTNGFRSSPKWKNWKNMAEDTVEYLNSNGIICTLVPETIDEVIGV